MNGIMSFGGRKNMSRQKKPAGGLNIIIVGCGKVGTTLVEQLVKEGHDITIVDKNAKKIQEYIQNQLKNDLEYDQLTLNEYIDPFTGEPVKKGRKK